MALGWGDSMHLFLKSLYAVIFLSQSTSLFVTTKLVGLPSSVVNIASMIGLLLFMLFNYRATTLATLNKHSVLFLVVTLILPFYVSLLNFSMYSGGFDLRAFGVRVLLVFLCFSTMVYFLRYGYLSLSKLFVISVYIAFFGLLLSVLNPLIFYVFAEENQANAVLTGRAFGFYLQPNIAAASLNALYLSIACMQRRIPSHLVSLVCFFGILLTASRAGIALFVAVFLILFISRSNKGLLLGFFVRLPKLVFVGFAAGLALIATISLYKNYGPKTEMEFSAAKRLTAIVDLGAKKSVSVITKDSDSRIDSVMRYVGYVQDHPLGYGLGATQRMAASGHFLHSPHNQYVIVAFETGVFGLGLYLIWLVSIFARKKKQLAWAFAVSVFLFLSFYGLVSNTLFSNRCIYLLIAVYSICCMYGFQRTGFVPHK